MRETTSGHSSTNRRSVDEFAESRINKLFSTLTIESFAQVNVTVGSEIPRALNVRTKRSDYAPSWLHTTGMNKHKTERTGTNRRRVDTFEAAKITGLSPKTLDKRRTLGLPPSWYKVGRAARYDVAELEDWLAGNHREVPA
jgi:hypothetical protein